MYIQYPYSKLYTDSILRKIMTPLRTFWLLSKTLCYFQEGNWDFVNGIRGILAQVFLRSPGMLPRRKG